MPTRAVEIMPQAYARVGGVLYLIIIVNALFAEGFVRNSLIVPSDAAATASNILAHESLFRSSIVADLVNYSCDVAVAVILYFLLKPISRNLAMLAAIFRVLTDGIGGLNLLNQYRVLQLLGGADYLKVFNSEQLQAMALLSIKAHSSGYAIALVFFGFGCLILGYLIYRSSFLPWILGILLGIAGLGYLINSFALIQAPTIQSMLFPWTLLPGFVAELSLALWLTIKGINVEKWREKSHRVE
jgi:hypothetical protein